ncbi:MAG: AtpZ/AtpI family protein [Dehalococcoidia bacterium]|nr:AtpZ/AtpI family protein [Dehalococcoidia bacterium]
MSRRGVGLALRLMGLGWYIAASIILGIVGGWWLDRWLGTLPLFTILGVIAGSGVAFYGVYRMILPLIGNNGANEQ